MSVKDAFVARMRTLNPGFEPSALEYTGDELTLYISGPNTIAHKNYLNAIGCKWFSTEKRWRYIRNDEPKGPVEEYQQVPQQIPQQAPEGVPATFFAEMRAISPDFPFTKVTYELADGVLNLSGEPTRTYRAFLKILKFRWNPATLKWYRNV